MQTAAKKNYYPYIINDPKISNGSPLIEGTRITVWNIAGYYQMGMNVDEILVNLGKFTKIRTPFH